MILTIFVIAGTFANKPVLTMETVLLQITNQKAYRLLEDLEDLDVVKVLSKSVTSGQKLSDKYAGKLPADIAEELQNYVNQSRKEWDSRSI